MAPNISAHPVHSSAPAPAQKWLNVFQCCKFLRFLGHVMVLFVVSLLAVWHDLELLFHIQTDCFTYILVSFWAIPLPCIVAYHTHMAMLECDVQRAHTALLCHRITTHMLTHLHLSCVVSINSLGWWDFPSTQLLLWSLLRSSPAITLVKSSGHQLPSPFSQQW